MVPSPPARPSLKRATASTESTGVRLSVVSAITLCLAALVIPRLLSNRSIDPCDPVALGDDLGTITGVYRIEDGQVNGVCFGRGDDELSRAWASFSAITTADERAALEGFAIYDGTFAGYTQQLDRGGTSFLIAVNRTTAQAHSQVLRHTMAHEFAHLFTGQASNPWNGAETAMVDCLSEENLYGCAGWDNYLATWTYQFWPDNEIERLGTHGHRSSTEAARRCSVGGGFVDEYGATNPSEDFAESFAAFVLSTPVPAGARPRIDFMASKPELVQIRNRIHAAGLTAPDLVLEGCR